MATLGEILRWVVYTVSHAYYRAAMYIMRRDRLLSGSERKFRALLESAPDAMVLVDSRGHIALVNAQTEKLFGYRREELIGQSVHDLVPEDSRARHRQHHKGYMKNATRRAMGHDLELRGRRKDGTEFPVEVSLSPMETDEGTLVMSAIRDVTERKDAEAQLRHLAEHDVLTGLLNRRCFEQNFEREVAIGSRYGTEGALLLLDIDSLKDINDTLGHPCGDELLRRVATLLRARLRNTDIIARLGGDEFAVILPHTDIVQATALTEELLQTIREGVMVVGSKRVGVSCSAGIAGFGEGALPEDVMLAADVSLYAAKDQGRDRVIVHRPGHGEVVKRQVRASWTQRLREILDADALVPYRQPILDTMLGYVTQYELLVRVLNEAGQPIAPSNFLPTAERTGMIVQIDRFMVERALELIVEQSRVGAPGVPMSYAVNLSARTLADPGLPRILARRVETSGIDPRLLVFEVTETAAIANMEAAREFAAPLRELGCTFALDDFGSGFASFFHLKHLPLDWLKIDGDYIKDLPHSTTDQVIVRNVAEIGRNLGLRTTAEFVGDQQTLDMVTRYGVSHAQGFFIGHPEPAYDRAGVAVDDLGRTGHEHG
ncbi:putative bifunctional diguanylate cyclase/phosphodiesterase [Paraconexibacter sp.]|uniref:putative bifunctional diguanylate cyclase/phosphodiesterase n=1 Tax=Paraconexibacter sp. TaxID=2949640 RepID=UPI003562E2E9